MIVEKDNMEKEKKPKLSIITVCYNEKLDISKTCDSVVAQTFSDYEWIVIDGGSTDGTLDVLKEYESNITLLVSEKDRGVYDAMNKGIKFASGEYVLFLNGGDSLFEKDILLKIFENNSYREDVLYGDCCLWDIDGTAKILNFKEKISRSYFVNHNINHQATFIRKALFDKYGFYDESYRVLADYDKWNAFAVGNVSFGKLPFVVSNFKWYEGLSSSENTKSLMKEEEGIILRKYFKNYEIFSYKIFEKIKFACFSPRKFIKKYFSLFFGNAKKENLFVDKNINVFIISYNRLKYLRELVCWLGKAGFENIHIVDNNSTYPPLLEYFSMSKHKVHRLEKNYGHLVVWKCGKFNEIIDNKNYIVTDCDVLPIEECPFDIVRYFLGILGRYPKVTKVGFGLKIDDLPQHYQYKDSVVKWEQQFWKKKLEGNFFSANIDTTFALYRKGIYPDSKKWWRSIRTDFPYLGRHLPWYENLKNKSEEDVFYQNSLENKSSFWSVDDVELLKKYSQELNVQLGEVYSSKKWRILKALYFFGSKVTFGKGFNKKIGTKKILQTGNIFDVVFLQRYNREIAEELGIITSSSAWKFVEKIEKIFPK